MRSWIHAFLITQSQESKWNLPLLSWQCSSNITPTKEEWLVTMATSVSKVMERSRSLSVYRTCTRHLSNFIADWVVYRCLKTIKYTKYHSKLLQIVETLHILKHFLLFSIEYHCVLSTSHILFRDSVVYCTYCTYIKNLGFFFNVNIKCTMKTPTDQYSLQYINHMKWLTNKDWFCSHDISIPLSQRTYLRSPFESFDHRSSISGQSDSTFFSWS